MCTCICCVGSFWLFSPSLMTAVVLINLQICHWHANEIMRYEHYSIARYKNQSLPTCVFRRAYVGARYIVSWTLTRVHCISSWKHISNDELPSDGNYIGITDALCRYNLIFNVTKEKNIIYLLRIAYNSGRFLGMQSTECCVTLELIYLP